MCGIAGWLGLPAPDPGAVAGTHAALRHRGPDDSGYRTFDDAGLIHTRLKILDLSDTGHQPMPHVDGSVWTVFNGEIYNHHELRQELTAHGHRFRGRSDTEVIPALYRHCGPGFASRLRGMFAIAVYDVEHHRLVLARDRFGIKPLYYSIARDRIGFASELNALRALGTVGNDIDRQAVYDFLGLLFVPAPSTFFREARVLEPGHILEATIENGKVVWSIRRYHQWTIAPNESLTIDSAASRASDLIDRAVQRQLESDVPLGGLLSGGIDSSLVSAAARRTAGRRFRTFNVKFADPDYDETQAALAVASRLGTTHETLDFGDGAPTWEGVSRLLTAVGQPYADTSLFAVHAICRLMRERVTVVLSGDGGDEGFGGYSYFRRLRAFALTQRLPSTMQRAAWNAAAAVGGGTAALSLVAPQWPNRFHDAARATDPTGALECLLSWIRPAELGRLWRGGEVAPVRRLYERRWEHVLPRRSGRLERLSAQATEVAIRLRLANDYLTKVDTASMLTSLEVRVPLLDEDLVAFGLTLPHRLKTHARTGKRVLREVARQRLPAEVVSLPKHGFSVPVDTWAGREFKARLRDELLGTGSRLDELLAPEEYGPLVTAFCEGRRHPAMTREALYERVFMLLSLHLALTDRPRRAQ